MSNEDDDVKEAGMLRTYLSDNFGIEPEKADVEEDEYVDKDLGGFVRTPDDLTQEQKDDAKLDEYYKANFPQG